jgi:acyl carrier protein
MNQTEAIARLQEIFNDVFLDPVTLTSEMSARDVEEWDSLTQISLLVAVEKAFNIKFRVGEVESTQNIGEFADLIVRRLNGN